MSRESPNLRKQIQLYKIREEKASTKMKTIFTKIKIEKKVLYKKVDLSIKSLHIVGYVDWVQSIA